MTRECIPQELKPMIVCAVTSSYEKMSSGVYYIPSITLGA
eukprot:CAMPEP_0201897718 /NCGR_PEP_ID=MMETSP0902-20130614/47117_1 /ASSEMBLY_ACC=CAM_ASM_000551 /TAXON_ID=420261 /ORGANISM="Thalassiosira antarctica, Strain CCMP982" /LENGTH=39 /DNA_ID= /DNA_START= /DNA_END= /DNA_ORIENTATION=